MRLLSVLTILLAATAAQAGVQAYSGPSGEKLFIESATSLGADANLVKFEGPTSDWAAKPILVKFQERPSANRYVINYKKKVGSRTKDEQYQIIVENGQDLINGSLVKKVQLFFPEAKGKPVVLRYDDGLTKSSQAINLAGAHAKSPFTPKVP